MSVHHRAVVLLSGGMDSAVTLAWMRREGYACTALSFDYGQRHRIELDRAARLATALGADEHVLQRIDLRAFGGSALTSDVEVPKDRPGLGRATASTGEAVAARTEQASHGVPGAIPITYVPARNTVFLSFALALAEVRGATAIAIGANAVDYSGYPDCRPEYLRAFEAMANLATKAAIEGSRIEIRGPLVSLSKAQIVRMAVELGVDPSQTVSCYQSDAQGRACGVCDACRLRKAGFEAAGLPDPTRYR